MQKLSRINKYRDYRNELNNGGEREIATRELKEFQDKIILNEKRFGSSSRTESDLNRGKRSTSFDGLNIPSNINSNYDYYEKESEESTDLDDIFSELNRYKKTPSHSKENNEQDDYIRRIKEIVSNAGIQRDDSTDHQKSSSIDNDPFSDLTPLENHSFTDDLIPLDEPETTDEYIPPEEIAPIEEPQTVAPYSYQPKNDLYAEFEETKHESSQIVNESQIGDVVLEKPVIKPIVPQDDYSKEFKEICDNVNSLAEKIEESTSLAQLQYIPQPKKRMPETSLEGMQQSINKDLMNSDDSFMDSLKQEVEQYRKNEAIGNTEIEEKKVIERKKEDNKKDEISANMKQEYASTISLEVSKLVDEINSSKADDISADDFINDYDSAKNDMSEDQSGKTIAFEINKNDIPDNTIVLSKPNLDDSSIHTMSFRTEELDVEDEKSNSLLNIILVVLILIAVAALCVIIYFFLITRGII